MVISSQFVVINPWDTQILKGLQFLCAATLLGRWDLLLGVPRYRMLAEERLPERILRKSVLF